MKYPKLIYVRIEEQGTEDESILAFRTTTEAAEADEDVEVGVYQLIEGGYVRAPSTFVASPIKNK